MQRRRHVLLRLTRRAGRALAAHIEVRLGGAARARVVVVLACVLVAGLFGAATASKRILFVQALPAALALVAVWMR